MDQTRRGPAEPPLQPPDPEGIDKIIELEGGRGPLDQSAFIDETDTDRLHNPTTSTEIYEGELEAQGGAARERGDLPLETLTELELREGETDNPDVAAEEGLAWVPPSDPPVIPDEDDPQGIQIAAGFGSSALDEPFDEDHHTTALPEDDEFAARIREALRADAATSRYADVVGIGTRDGVVALRGVVDDLDDSDNVAAVVETVTGVTEVIDELEVRALE
jgi:hypothetical protein